MSTFTAFVQEMLGGSVHSCYWSWCMRVWVPL